MTAYASRFTRQIVVRRMGDRVSQDCSTLSLRDTGKSIGIPMQANTNIYIYMYIFHFNSTFCFCWLSVLVLMPSFGSNLPVKELLPLHDQPALMSDMIC